VPTSRIPEVWSAVFASLTTAFAAEPSVTVTYGEPLPHEVDREAVIVGPVERWAQEWAGFPTSAPRVRREGFDLQVQVLVADASASSFQSPVERAFDMAATVETTLRSNQTFGVEGVSFSEPASSGGVQPFWTDDGMAVLLTISVGVTARI